MASADSPCGKQGAWSRFGIPRPDPDLNCTAANLYKILSQSTRLEYWLFIGRVVGAERHKLASFVGSEELSMLTARHSILKRVTKSVLIAVSAILLLRFVSETTNSLALALSYAVAFGTWRNYEEFARRKLSTAPKMAGSAIAFFVAVVHGALATPRTSAPLGDVLYFGAFLLPEVIILLFSRRAKIEDVAIRIPRKKRKCLAGCGKRGIGIQGQMPVEDGSVRFSCPGGVWKA